MKYLTIFLVILASLSFMFCEKKTESHLAKRESTIVIEGLTDDSNLFLEDQINHLKGLAEEEIIIKAIQACNEKNKKLTKEEISRLDNEWQQNNSEDNPFIKKLLFDECSDQLRNFQAHRPQYLEIFVMDNKGLIVAESDITSDYLQADEAKWSEVFGKNKVWHGKLEYDKSSNAPGVQVSIPVKDIGAICATISLRNRHTVR